MKGEGRSRSYRCSEPPCIHVVIDERRGIFKVFVEDYDRIIPIRVEDISRACRILSDAISRGRLREANEGETDFLARRYLEAEPIEEPV